MRLKFDSQLLGAMPIVNHFIGRLQLDQALETAVPHDDARVLLAPAVVLGAVARHLAVEHRPLYAIGEWAANYAPELLGLGDSEFDLLNDDRVGRTLTRLFDADRACSRAWCSPWCAPSRSIVRNSTTTPRRSP